MDLKLSICNLLVHDQDAALAFYRDVLGLEVRNEVPMGAFRWVTVGPPSQPEIEITLETPAMGNWPQEDAEAITALMSRHVINTLIFRVENCDAACETLRSAGARELQAPTDQPWGVRDCAFYDPSGNQVRFSQPLAR